MVSSHTRSAMPEHTCIKAALHLDKPLELEKKSHNFCGELSTFGQSGIQIVTLQNHCSKQSYVSVHSKVEKIGL